MTLDQKIAATVLLFGFLGFAVAVICEDDREHDWWVPSVGLTSFGAMVCAGLWLILRAIWSAQ